MYACVSQLSIIINGKGSFGFTVLEVAVHDQADQLLVGL
jgi:hypothetical protein